MGCAHGKSQDAHSPTIIVEEPTRVSNRSNVASPAVWDKVVHKPEQPPVLLLPAGYRSSPKAPPPVSDAFLRAVASPQSVSLADDFGNDPDLDLNLPRFSQVSSQFIAPNGSKVVSVPKYNYELRFSFLTQRGYYPEALDKANQDSLCVHAPFGNDPNDHFFGVFDGHGEFGTLCSQFARKQLCENMLRNRHFTKDALKSYHAAFVATNLQLHRYHIDDSMSGTTGITVLVRGKTLYVANVGDSRAVVAERRGKKLHAVDLSNDQTPFRTDECARVRLCGARVLTLDQLEGLKNPDIQCWGGEEDDDGDPPRLWVANGMYPGTAFTRSIGDTVAEQIGVIAVPEVLIMELTGSHPFFVVASDGVFEFLSSQAVVDMVAKHKDPQEACAAIVAESYRLWLQNETRTDDITVIVVFIDGIEGSIEKKGSMKRGVNSPAICNDGEVFDRGDSLPVFGETRQISSAGRRVPKEPQDLPAFSLDEDPHEEHEVELRDSFQRHSYDRDTWDKGRGFVNTVAGSPVHTVEEDYDDMSPLSSNHDAEQAFNRNCDIVNGIATASSPDDELVSGGILPESNGTSELGEDFPRSPKHYELVPEEKQRRKIEIVSVPEKLSNPITPRSLPHQ